MPTTSSVSSKYPAHTYVTIATTGADASRRTRTRRPLGRTVRWTDPGSMSGMDRFGGEARVMVGGSSRFRVPGSGFQVPGSKFRFPSERHSELGTGNQEPGTWTRNLPSMPAERPSPHDRQPRDKARQPVRAQPQEIVDGQRAALANGAIHAIEQV